MSFFFSVTYTHTYIPVDTHTAPPPSGPPSPLHLPKKSWNTDASCCTFRAAQGCKIPSKHHLVTRSKCTKQIFAHMQFKIATKNLVFRPQGPPYFF